MRTGTKLVLSNIVLLLTYLFILPPTSAPALAQMVVGTLVVEWAEPPPAPGWVPVAILLVESGCYGTDCYSRWTPDPQEYLFELLPERTYVASGVGSEAPPSALPVADPRARCLGTIAAGDWHHNAIWRTRWTFESNPITRVTTWSEAWDAAPTWEGWNFAETDRCPRPTPTPYVPTPVPGSSQCTPACSGQRNSQAPPQTRVWIEPPNPVVITQDPDRLGCTIHVEITSYPVLHEWQECEVVRTETTDYCVHTDAVTGQRDARQRDMEPCDNDWPGWSRESETVEVWGCVWHSELIPDQIDTGSIRLDAALTLESVAWIEDDLAQRYPGIGVRHPNWLHLPVTWRVDFYDDYTYVAHGQVNLQVEDPGIYDYTLSGSTAGTTFTPGRSLDRDGSFNVYFLGETLIE